MIHTPAVSLDVAARFVATIERRRLPLAALLTANGASHLGRQITTLAVPWAIYTATGSPAQTGLAATCLLLPWLLTNPDRNLFVGHFGPKQTSIVAGALGGAMVAAIPLLDLPARLPIAPFLLFVFLCACVTDLDVVARRPLLPGATEQAGLPVGQGGIAVRAATRGALVAGPFLAWLGIVHLGVVATIGFAAACFAVAAAADILPRDAP